MRLQYFIPDWDDRVDPNFDFATDTHTPDRNPYRDDVYAHEIYNDAPPYDGILLSLATLDNNPRKRQAIEDAQSVHKYLRLPSSGNHLVLGDCGAFTYWQKDIPPYTTEQALHLYQTLGFDLGVSVDHLIFAELAAERERRWDITINNAEAFLHDHQRGGFTFTPIGVAQGWDVASYQMAARALVQMGYTYIAVGGLVRSSADEIIRTLQAIKEELRNGMRVHLFGVSRPEHAATFAQLGVTSFDSASRLRRAWMDGRRNYFLEDLTFTAIRIPDYKTIIRDTEHDATTAYALEQQALNGIRDYAANRQSIDDTLTKIKAYIALQGQIPSPVFAAYRETLLKRPWEVCSCRICQEIGVEVVIFRGNNRNRRRGFHNTWQLYQQLANLTHGPTIEPFQLELQL